MTRILVETLRHGPATVLTNGTVLQEEWLDRLSRADRDSMFSLEFRVSIDGITAAQNDPIRGKGTFDRAMQGVKKLVDYNFLPIITAVRTWNPNDDLKIIEGFQELLADVGYLRPRLKILPTLQIGAEVNRSGGYSAADRLTHAMMEEYDASLLICNHSRVVTDRGIHVCPILIESADSLLGQTLAESVKPFPLTHGACVTCYQYGAICSNATTQLQNQKRPIEPKSSL